jgi:hypothetical protein
MNMGGGGGGARGGARGGGPGARGGGAPRGGGAGPGAPGIGAPPRAGAAAGAAPRGGGPGGGGAAAQAPIVLSRNGKEFRITGNQSTVKAGAEITVKTERPEVSFSLSEMDKGSWVMFELPGFANADSATKQDSLDALRKASETSYFKDKDSLWVKVVVPNPPAQPISPLERQVSVRVSR